MPGPGKRRASENEGSLPFRTRTSALDLPISIGGEMPAAVTSGIDAGVMRNRGHPAPIRASGAGTLLRIAIGWMMCQGRHPLRRHHPSSPKKPRCRPRAGSGRSTRDPCILPGASGPRPAITIATIPLCDVATPPTPYVRKRCAATADRGPDGCRGKHAVLGRSVAPGEGTGSRIFQRARWRHDGAKRRRGTDPPDRDP